MDPETTRFIRDQFWYLHAEYLARILIQNLILLLQLALFAGMVIGMAAFPAAAPGLAMAFSLQSLAASVIWNHSGRRQVQIRAYLMEIAEPMLGNRFLGWEHFLRRRRIASRLGAMWRVGTIGVFCTLPVAATLLLGTLASMHGGAVIVTSGCVVAILALTAHPPVQSEQQTPDVGRTPWP